MQLLGGGAWLVEAVTSEVGVAFEGSTQPVILGLLSVNSTFSVILLPQCEPPYHALWAIVD